MLQLSQGSFHAGLWQHRASLLEDLVGTVQFPQIALNGLVDLSQFLTQLTACIIFGLGVDGLKSAAINGNDVTVS